MMTTTSDQGITMGAVAARTDPTGPATAPQDVVAATRRFRDSATLLTDPATQRIGIAFAGAPASGAGAVWPVVGVLPPIFPEWLGDRGFNNSHRTRFPYVMGAMANGIATTELVIEAAHAGCLGFFGAGGLEFSRVQSAIADLTDALGSTDLPWGANLIHSPSDLALEESVADLFVRERVRRVSASAYMDLTPAIVRYAIVGLARDANGSVVRSNKVFAKISRPEVAAKFMAPAPSDIVSDLLARQLITQAEAQLAAEVPIAEDITVESDSGGHTDRRPLGPLFCEIQDVRDRSIAAHGYRRPIRLGAAGGIGTPVAAASAFALGAAYILTGSINQACVESGLSHEGKAMLAKADIADMMMAPAGDMFELGVELQVLKRGTMFGPRAKKLYQLYRAHDSLESIQGSDRTNLEKRVLGMSVEDSWKGTQAFWKGRDPSQLAKAAADPKHKMALVFRSYLGLSSRWAINGDSPRSMDYQIWCGPAMGAFNAWAKDSFLAEPQARTVAQVAHNLMEGAAVITRANQFRSHGVSVPAAAYNYQPQPLAS